MSSVCVRFRNSFVTLLVPLYFGEYCMRMHVCPAPRDPFLAQSVQFLERPLVESERLAQWWMTRPMRFKSTAEVSIDALPNGPLKIFNNKWLVSFEHPGKFVIHDLDKRTVQEVPCSRQVHLESHLNFVWETCSVTSLEGPVLYIMFSHMPPRSWKFLEFRVDSDTGHLYLSLSLTAPGRYIRPFVKLDSGHGPFFRIEDAKLAFHVDKRRLYRTTPFRVVLPVNSLPPGGDRMEKHTLLAKTHIVILTPFSYLSSTETLQTRRHVMTIVQAFRLPASGDSDPDAIRLSHEGVICGSKRPQFVHIIRNSLVDPINGATSIRLLDQCIEVDGTVRFSHIDLTLPKHTHTDLDLEVVLPMTVHTHDITRLLMPDDIEYDWQNHVAFSDDGYVRGFGLCRHVRGAIAHFTMDASQDQCTAVITPLPLDRKESAAFIRLLKSAHFWMDGATGKMCTTRMDRQGRKYIVVWNIE
ncbi:hypothetical protein JVU11DRAFT_8667 [Chiua virens]|nr:hypothetical protein JVU11DRAFT_8667 [Chiua virens]